jgi:hypothetical protein
MKKINFALIIIGLFGIVTFQIVIYRKNMPPSPIDEMVQKGLLDKRAYSYVPPETFNRMDLILKIVKGDGKAAFEMGCFYSKAELPEAAFYWFGISRKLGHEGISKDGLEFYEHNIIDKYAK